MTNTFELLENKRREFNTFVASVVQPLLGLNEKEIDKLGTSGVAKLIGDLNVRNRYCDLAIAMLDANIAHYRLDATFMRIPSLNNTAVVASTLIVAAIAQYQSGTVFALLASAAWYWLANETSSRRLDQLTKNAEAHNETVTEWVETLQEWEEERAELRSLLA